MKKLTLILIYSLFSSPFFLLFPQNSIYDSLAIIAQAELDEKNYLDAIAHYSQAISERPDSIALYLERAKAYTNIKSDKAAYDDVHIALMVNQDNADIYYLIGEIEKNAGNLDGALANFKQVLSITPGHVDAIAEIVDIYLKNNKLQRAGIFIESAVSDNLTNGKLHFYNGLVKHAKGDYQEALKSFHSSLIFSHSIDSSDYYLNIGNAHFGLNDLMQAKEDYSKSIDHNPMKTKAYYVRGMINFQLGYHNDALRDFNAAIRMMKMDAGGAEYWQNMIEKKDNLVADTIVYDVVVKNPNPDDPYMEKNLRHLKRQKLISEIAQAVFNGQIVAYDFITREPINEKRLKNIKKEFDVEQIGLVKFNEQWYFDKNDFTMEKKVSSIVLGYEVKDRKGNFRGYKPYFEVHLNSYLK